MASGWAVALLEAVLAPIGAPVPDATITKPPVPAVTASDASEDGTATASGDESSYTSFNTGADVIAAASDDGSGRITSTQTTVDPTDGLTAIPLPSATAGDLEFSFRAIHHLEDDSPWSPLPVDSSLMTEVLTMVDAYDLEVVLRATIKVVDASKSANVITRTDNSSTDTDPFVLFLGAATLNDTVALDRLAEIILNQPKEKAPGRPPPSHRREAGPSLPSRALHNRP